MLWHRLGRYAWIPLVIRSSPSPVLPARVPHPCSSIYPLALVLPSSSFLCATPHFSLAGFSPTPRVPFGLSRPLLLLSHRAIRGSSLYTRFARCWYCAMVVVSVGSYSPRSFQHELNLPPWSARFCRPSTLSAYISLACLFHALSPAAVHRIIRLLETFCYSPADLCHCASTQRVLSLPARRVDSHLLQPLRCSLSVRPTVTFARAGSRQCPVTAALPGSPLIQLPTATTSYWLQFGDAGPPPSRSVAVVLPVLPRWAAPVPTGLLKLAASRVKLASAFGLPQRCLALLRVLLWWSCLRRWRYVWRRESSLPLAGRTRLACRFSCASALLSSSLELPPASRTCKRVICRLPLSLTCFNLRRPAFTWP